MSTWIALLRGIGGGIRTLPMNDLKATLAKAGLGEVQTYIQTGNVVFEDAKRSAEVLGKLIGTAIAEDLGMDIPVMVVSSKELARAVADNPFEAAAGKNPKSVHLFFLARSATKPNLERMKELS